MQASQRRRLRIGLLFDSFWDDFEAQVWRGVVDEARTQNISLRCFAAGSIDSPYSNAANRAVLHDLVVPGALDGLLVMSGCIGPFLTHAQLRQFLRRFADLPLLSVSTRFDDIPSIVVDNRSGIYELLTHLILHHGRSRIAFITGAMNAFDAQERYAAYRNALSDHGIAFDPELVAQGNFVHESGGRAVRTLVQERRVHFDALVAANDYMALDAMRVLQSLGINVPGDVSIGGFDDAKDGRSVQPALTTVRQPTYELGRRAVRDMVQWLQTGKPTETITLPTRLVTRSSCGCVPVGARGHRDDTGALNLSSTPPSGAVDDAIATLTSKLSRRFITVTDILGSDVWAQRLLSAYLAEHHGLTRAFVDALEAILFECEDKPVEPAAWGEVLHYMFGLLRVYGPSDSAVRDTAFLALNNQVERRQAALWVEYERQTQLLQRFQQPLSASFDLSLFGTIIRDVLPRLRIDACWLALYEDPEHNTRGASYPVLQFDSRRGEHQAMRTYHSTEAPRFPSSELIPGGFGDGDARLVNIFSLSFENEHFGFAVYEIDNLNAEVYEILNAQVTSLIKGFRLLEQTRDYTDKLERDVAARTIDLQRANDALRNKNREIQKLNEELHEFSRVDGLTNLYNRRAFFELLRMELNRTRRTIVRERTKEPAQRLPPEHQVFAVMMIDIDHFKRINDNYGHLIGDMVLKRVGEMLNEPELLRLEHMAGRFGGEEFIMILPSTSSEQALLPARRFAERIRVTDFHGKNGEPFSVTLSVGISQYREDDDNEEAVIHRADQALYHAKKTGRDRIVVYEHLYGAKLPA
jgi:diguanylate cyclase (GGDEF)-like protein